MTTGDRQTAIRTALAVVRECADTLDAQADSLLEALADAPMDAPLRAKATELCAALKDRGGRVAFELAIIETDLESADGAGTNAVRRLVGLDATMMDALAPLAELADQLERAAELDPDQERAFVLVIEAAGVMLQRLDRARRAMAAVGG